MLALHLHKTRFIITSMWNRYRVVSLFRMPRPIIALSRNAPLGEMWQPKEWLQRWLETCMTDFWVQSPCWPLHRWTRVTRLNLRPISFPESLLPLSSGGAANKELWGEAIRHDRILGLPVLLRKSGGSLYPRGPCWLLHRWTRVMRTLGMRLTWGNFAELGFYESQVRLFTMK